MKKNIFIWVFIILILLLFKIAHANISEKLIIKAEKEAQQALIDAELARVAYLNSLSVKELIYHLAPENGAILDTVAKCESGYRKVINYNDGAQGSHSYYWFQYKLGTWDWFSKMYGEELDIESVYDQIKLTDYAISKGYGFHWSCYSRFYGK